MSIKLGELQGIAEKNGAKYFSEDRRMVCLHATLYALQDALKTVDKVNYVHPDVIKASNGLPAGLWSSTGSCGIVLAGGIAISLKHGTTDPFDTSTVFQTGMKAREWYRWFQQEYGSCDCVDLSLVSDWSNEDSRNWYNANQRKTCTKYLKESARKLVEILTEENPKVLRE